MIKGLLDNIFLLGHLCIIEIRFTVIEDGFVYYRDRVCVPNDDELKKSILEQAHSGSFAMHPGSIKMY